MFCCFRIVKDPCLIVFSKTESEFFNYMSTVVRNLMLNVSWNHVSKIHSFKILNKNIKKTRRGQLFKNL